MSEESSHFREIKEKPRSKKLHPRVDLVAMVSVSFLLIVFFMVTKELARPQSMHLGSRETGCGPEPAGCYRSDRVITLLLDGNNKIISYSGILQYPYQKPKRLNYGKEGIRRELIIKNRTYKQLSGGDKGIIVMIKPSKKSNYGNLIDILDEMKINNISSYAIVNEFTPEELQLIASR